MTLTFRQLEIFVVAAEECNFRRTADQLAITQPSVSNHIRALERHLGVNLFVRRKGIAPALTLEGARFLEMAQELVNGHAAMGCHDQPSHGANAVRLTIMAGPLLLDTCIRPRLADFCATYPRMSLQFTSLHPSRSAAQLIERGEIDMAIYTGEPAVEEHLQTETIESVGCSIYAAPKLALCARQPATALEDLPWVMPPRDFAPASFMWRYLNDAGIRPRTIAASSQFPDVVAQLAIDGRGITVLFDDFAAPLQAGGRIVRIGPDLPKTSRVLLIGRRASRAACGPVVNLLRHALRTPLGSAPPHQG
jgi:DNA-binding transcriptional LysR family regulator